MIVLSIDPGVTTGIALVEFGADSARVVETCEPTPPTAYTTMRRMVAAHRSEDLRVVAESFTITARTGKVNAPGTSLEVIGALRAILHETGLGWDALVLQRPADAKSLISNEMLRQEGLWHRGGGGHAVDALRHAALYAVRNGWKPKAVTSE